MVYRNSWRRLEHWDGGWEAVNALSEFKKRELTKVMTQQAVSIHYQPIIDVGSSDIFAHESLARCKTSQGVLPGAEVIAIGVETEEQVNIVRDLGADAAQGYYFCRPLPPSGLGHFLETDTIS